MFQADNYFCCKCGRYKSELDEDLDTVINNFTLISGSIYCKQCWDKTDFFCKGDGI